MALRVPDESEGEVRPVVLPWDKFSEMFLAAHEQGEHIAIEGPNGSGKSLLGLELCKLIGSRKTSGGRPTRCTVLAVKPSDKTLSDFQKQQKWPVLKTWPPSYGQEQNIVWPRSRNWSASKQAEVQRKIFLPLLDEIYVEGGQTIEIDEEAYFERPQPHGLGLGPTMENFWSMARSNDNTVIGVTQRPRHVTLLMWSESQWVFIFKPEDDRDLDTVARASGRRWEVMVIAQQLGAHEFLCVQRQRKGPHQLYVSKVEIRKEKSETKTDPRK